MGNIVSARFEWTETSPEARKNGLAHLQTSVGNQELLYDLINMIEQLCHTYPLEAKAEFRMPIVWTSRIAPNAFSGHSSTGLWIIKDSSKFFILIRSHKSSVSSVAARGDGQPLFYMEQIASTDIPVYKAKVASFDYLYKFLQVFNDN